MGGGPDGGLDFCGLHFGSYTGGMLLYPGAPASALDLLLANAHTHAARLATKL